MRRCQGCWRNPAQSWAEQSKKLGLGVRSPHWAGICQGKVWDLLSFLQWGKDGRLRIWGRRGVMWKDTRLQGCDLWNTQHVGGSETELPCSRHSLTVSMDPCGKTASPPPTLGSGERDRLAQPRAWSAPGQWVSRACFAGELHQGQAIA